LIIAGLFYASQYYNVRLLYSVSGGNVEILSGTSDTLNRSNEYVFKYFSEGKATGFSTNFDDYKMIVYNFQVQLSKVNDLIIYLGVACLVCFALLLVLSNHNRRIYYKSNLFGGVLLPLVVVVLNVILLAQNFSVMTKFNEGQNFELFNLVSLLQGDSQIVYSQKEYSVLQSNFTCDNLTFILFTVLFVIVIAYSVFMAIYAVLKYKATAEERAEIVKKAVANND
jgi:hypothetical protein